MTASALAWRPVFAALAHDTTRRLYAEIVLEMDGAGSRLSPSRRRHALEALQNAGLIVADAGGWRAVDSFSAVLAASPVPRRKGIERFLTREGKIDRYPVNLAERTALLRHVAEESFAPDEVLSETEVNERLERFSGDTAALRRYLIDAELLERTASGSQYARVPMP